MGGSMGVFSLSPSPDAQSIAFSSRATQEDVFLMKADGSELRQVTNDSPRDRGPSFSPDGRQLFFYSDREDGVYDIYRIATDGSGVARITQTNSNDRAPVWIPAQSPDGRWLAASGDHGFGLYDLDGDLPLTEYDTPPAYPDEALHCWRPEWSPDGLRLLVNLQHTESGTGRPGVVVYTIESREYELVHETGYPIAWIDDRTVLIEVDDDAVALDLETRDERAIELPDDAQRLYLAADGSTLIFVRSSFESDIWLADLGVTK
jgi:WD40 repeat protein